jgi:hypothetical protein
MADRQAEVFEDTLKSSFRRLFVASKALSDVTELGFENVAAGTPILPPMTPINAANPSSPQLLTSNSPNNATPPASIYRHIRNLAGVNGSIPASEVHWRTYDQSFPHLGDSAMAYLHAHGYDTPSILHIAANYQNSSTVNDFVWGLAREGLPIAEAHYIWCIIGQPILRHAYPFTF